MAKSLCKGPWAEHIHGDEADTAQKKRSLLPESIDSQYVHILL